MKTIVCQFCIYLILTTIYGTISKAVDTTNKGQNQVSSVKNTKNNCSLESVFFTLNQTNSCPILLAPSNSVLSESNAFFVPSSLCRGINDTVSKICHLHPDPNSDASIPIKKADLENEINKLNNFHDVDGFCKAMKEVIRNSSYVSIIKKGPPTSFNITKLNNDLHKDCNKMCYTSDSQSGNSICSALYWINKLLIITEMRISLPQRQGNAIPKAANQSNQTQSEQKLEEQRVENDLKLSAHFTPSSTSNAKILEKSQSGMPQQTKAAKSENMPKPLKKAETPIVTQGENTVEKKQEEKKKPVNNGADSPADKRQDLDKKKEENLPERQSNKNDATKGDGSVLETPLVGGSEQIIKDFLSSDENKDNGNVNEMDEGTQYEKDNLDIDTVEINEPPVNNDQSIGARPGPPEPPQHFFAYFMAISLTCLVCYIGFHKKQKIMAIVFEGRKSRGGRGRRRPNTAGYRKLDCTLEEAVTSQCNSNVTHVIY